MPDTKLTIRPAVAWSALDRQETAANCRTPEELRGSLPLRKRSTCAGTASAHMAVRLMRIAVVIDITGRLMTELYLVLRRIRLLLWGHYGVVSLGGLRSRDVARTDWTDHIPSALFIVDNRSSLDPNSMRERAAFCRLVGVGLNYLDQHWVVRRGVPRACDEFVQITSNANCKRRERLSKKLLSAGNSSRRLQQTLGREATTPRNVAMAARSRRRKRALPRLSH